MSITMTANLRRKWPAEALRVAVYAGIDPVTKRRHYLGEVIPAGLSAAKEADRAMRRMASQVDERRNPRTSATVDQMLDRYFEVVDLERNTVATDVGYAVRHIRPLVGRSSSASWVEMCSTRFTRSCAVAGSIVTGGRPSSAGRRACTSATSAARMCAGRWPRRRFGRSTSF
jgi:hypothetical protein